MARPRKGLRLHVWMNGEAVGVWMMDANGQHRFSYHAGWLASPRTRPLSLSLPLQAGTGAFRGEVVEAFFDNLLPDSREIRQRIQSRFRTASIRAFDLLAEIGRDCVGAVQLLPEGEVPQGVDRIEAVPLNEAQVAAVLRETPVTHGAGGDGDFRISLAGAQEKTALLWHEGAWHRPLGATPTTHIFKLPLGRVGNFRGDLSASVENEWLCAQIVRAYGLPVANCVIATFEEQKALVVERFDRRLSEDGRCWLRLPQEDMCQALGIPPALKYEADGGPGIRPIMDLLLGSRQAEQDRLQFFTAQIVFCLLCAPDGHAKNFSLAIEPQGRFRLTPLYDILSAYPMLGHGPNLLAPEKVKMAMAVIGKTKHYGWTDILVRHWLATAHAYGLQREAARHLIGKLTESTPAVISRVSAELPKGFPDSISEPILRGIETTAKKIEGAM